MTDFHFIRPLWLIALLLLVVIFYLLKRLRISNSGWQQVIPAHLSQKLIDGDNNQQNFSLITPCIIALLTIIALAGPAWQKLPQPVYNVQKGAVIIMDMSNSMYATDLSPNRLTRARYKAIDLLEKLNEGDIGLIAYAGDSFIISPLTQDINNIKLLLPSLSPSLMPVQGSNPLIALNMANEMLLNAGHIEGDIYWLTDDVDPYDIESISNFTNSINHRINILGIGTTTGAPIKMPDGQLLKDNTGAIVIPNLTDGSLLGLAQQGRGQYQTITHNSTDIIALVSSAKQKVELKEEQQQLTEGDQFKEAGPYLILFILPLLLGYFRRGSLLGLAPYLIPCLFYFTHMPTSFAQNEAEIAAENKQTTTSLEQAENSASNLWRNLWQTQNQQAQNSYNQEAYADAAKQFTDPLWQGSSHYKNGKYEEALKAFKQSDSAQALYNQGNSLAKMQKFDEAIKAYEKALKKDPTLAAAKANKTLIEELKKQQQEQQQQGDSDSSDKNQQNQDQDKQQSGENEQQNSEPSSEQNNEQNSDQNSDQNNEQQNAEQSSENSSEQNKEENSSEQQQNGEQNTDDENLSEEERLAQQAKQENEAGENDETTAAQLTQAEQAAQEEEQKNQHLLKKVTDDPYLLLRNKMQLEYQKRRHENSGVTKQW